MRTSKGTGKDSKGEECCPRFEPGEWDGKVFEWKDRKFIKDRVRTISYVPVGFGSVMKRLDEKVRKNGANIQDGLCLSDHTSRWNMDVYLAVDREVPGARNVTLSGKYLSKVYEGDFKETGKWCSDFEEYSKSRDLRIDKWYMWYTTCPKCARKYGKNYVVIIGKMA